MKNTFLILDSNSILYRTFFALPPLSTKEGIPTNGVYGFLLVFFKVLKEFTPKYLAACFDFPAPTFRHLQFKEYKITRPPSPKELIFQIKILKEILNEFRVPIFEKEGFEADDIIGTIIEKLKKENLEKIIVSGDRDVFQLVDENTKVYLLRTGPKSAVLVDRKLVKEKFFGLSPEQIPDFKALCGDSSDNIPGVRGIGEKTAIELLKLFGTIENLYHQLEEESKSQKIKESLKKILIEKKERVIFAKNLVKLEKSVPIDFELSKCEWGQYDKERIISLFKKYEFFSLIKRIEELNKKTTSPQYESIQKKLF